MHDDECLEYLEKGRVEQIRECAIVVGEYSTYIEYTHVTQPAPLNPTDCSRLTLIIMS